MTDDTLVASYWTEPRHDRTHRTYEWMCSSSPSSTYCAKDYMELASDPNNPVGCLFIDYNHDNLTSVVQGLVIKRGLTIVVSPEIVCSGKTGYFHPEYDAEKTTNELVKVPIMLMLGSEYIERVMHAGLQIFHHYGKTSHDGGEDHYYMHHEENGSTNIQTLFKYNGKRVFVTLLKDEYTTLGKPLLKIATTNY